MRSRPETRWLLKARTAIDTIGLQAMNVGTLIEEASSHSWGSQRTPEMRALPQLCAR